MRRQLEELLDHFDVTRHIARDPLQFPHRYRAEDDQEVVAFLASCLAFGRVAAFGAALERLLAELGPRPARWLRERGGDGALVPSLPAYRWLNSDDIGALLAAVGTVLQDFGSLEQLFLQGDDGASDTWTALGRFSAELRTRAEQHHRQPGERGRALSFLFPSSRGRSASKRQHLFLRWMVRPRGSLGDLGLWKGLSPSRLVVPCDVHVARISYALGLTSRAEASRRTADEITSALRRIDPLDPVRFDFALSHLGISGGCRGRRIESVCGVCDLRTVCRWWGAAGVSPLRTS
ncbi:MAG: TIGR02757 family protein [Myxococcota bacterium]|nr:TIGR02757 family protein [Myxococcota bacterium]